MNNTLKYILVAVIALLSIALITDRFLHEPTTAVQTPSRKPRSDRSKDCRFVSMATTAIRSAISCTSSGSSPKAV